MRWRRYWAALAGVLFEFVQPARAVSVCSCCGSAAACFGSDPNNSGRKRGIDFHPYYRGLTEVSAAALGQRVRVGPRLARPAAPAGRGLPARPLSHACQGCRWCEGAEGPACRVSGVRRERARGGRAASAPAGSRPRDGRCQPAGSSQHAECPSPGHRWPCQGREGGHAARRTGDLPRYLTTRNAFINPKTRLTKRRACVHVFATGPNVREYARGCIRTSDPPPRGVMAAQFCMPPRPRTWPRCVPPTR
jgi:hypothetical protein